MACGKRNWAFYRPKLHLRPLTFPPFGTRRSAASRCKTPVATELRPCRPRWKPRRDDQASVSWSPFPPDFSLLFCAPNFLRKSSLTALGALQKLLDDGRVPTSVIRVGYFSRHQSPCHVFAGHSFRLRPGPSRHVLTGRDFPFCAQKGVGQTCPGKQAVLQPVFFGWPRKSACPGQR